jgi:hypothetical protein
MAGSGQSLPGRPMDRSEAALGTSILHRKKSHFFVARPAALD